MPENQEAVSPQTRRTRAHSPSEVRASNPSKTTSGKEKKIGGTPTVKRIKPKRGPGRPLKRKNQISATGKPLGRPKKVKDV
uniref:Uncharacterized protein n=1 Tax=Haematobia irritans TaxID=7368 RepID=A0A1L8E9K3_HAEIR